MDDKREQEIRRQLDALGDELNTILFLRELDINSKLVGKCFRERNCNSLPSDESDCWWAYIKVLSVDENGQLYGLTFEKDRHGTISINANAKIFSELLADETTEMEFQEALSDCLRAIERMNPER